MSFADAIGIEQGDVLALVGAGGKTATSMIVGMELLARRWPVAACSTMTLLPAADPRITPIFVHQQSDVQHQIEEALDSLSLPWVVAGPTEQHDSWPEARREVAYPVAATNAKAAGMSVDKVDGLQEAWPDLTLIVEADGARHRWLKGPAEHEPQLPHRTTVLAPMAHLGVVGKPLGEEFVHRPERVARILDLPPGALLTPENVAAVLADAEGGLRGWHSGIRAVPVLTLDVPEITPIASRTAQALLAYPDISHVVVAWLGEGRWAGIVRRA
jgi:probable selenium-dependent hydroxylase accessory protein YqeC